MRGALVRAVALVVLLLGLGAPTMGGVVDKSLYETMGVPVTATQEEIKKAYRELSKKHHPDRKAFTAAEDKETSAARFAAINAAYEVLGDAEKRRIYDIHGSAGLQRHEEQQTREDSLFNFFGGFPGGDRFGHKRGFEKHPPQNVKLIVSLSQLYFGELFQVAFNRPVVCLRSDDCIVTKRGCSGPGVRSVTRQLGPGFVVQNQMDDSSCVDRDKAWKDNCSACPSGQTEMQKSHTTIFLEPGMKDGERIVHEGGGVQQMGYETGDLVFTVTQLPHASFERRGDDLHTTVYITLLEALVGFKKLFPHLDRKPLELTRSGVTHEGDRFVVAGKGMPMKDAKPSYGDLHVTFRIQYPTRLSGESEELVRKALKDVTEWKFEPLAKARA